MLGCKDSEDLSLTGRHLESLAELAINKFSAVSITVFAVCVGLLRFRRPKFNWPSSGVPS